MTIPRAFIFLSLPVVAVALLRAEEPQANAGASAEKPGPYVLKNRSAFGISKDARAPFWPIGWVRPNPNAPKSVIAAPAPVEEPAVKVFIEARHFKVTSVLSGNPPLATINGRSYGEGEVLPVMAGNSPLRVVVRTIRDGGVLLQQDEHSVFVPLNRPKYEPRAPVPAVEAQDFTIKIE